MAQKEDAGFRKVKAALEEAQRRGVIQRAVEGMEADTLKRLGEGMRADPARGLILPETIPPKEPVGVPVAKGKPAEAPSAQVVQPPREVGVAAGARLEVASPVGPLPVVGSRAELAKVLRGLEPTDFSSVMGEVGLVYVAVTGEITINSLFEGNVRGFVYLRPSYLFDHLRILADSPSVVLELEGAVAEGFGMDDVGTVDYLSYVSPYYARRAWAVMKPQTRMFSLGEGNSLDEVRGGLMLHPKIWDLADEAEWKWKEQRGETAGLTRFDVTAVERVDENRWKIKYIKSGKRGEMSLAFNPHNCQVVTDSPSIMGLVGRVDGGKLVVYDTSLVADGGKLLIREVLLRHMAPATDVVLGGDYPREIKVAQARLAVELQTNRIACICDSRNDSVTCNVQGRLCLKIDPEEVIPERIKVVVGKALDVVDDVGGGAQDIGQRLQDFSASMARVRGEIGGGRLVDDEGHVFDVDDEARGMLLAAGGPLDRISAIVNKLVGKVSGT